MQPIKPIVELNTSLKYKSDQLRFDIVLWNLMDQCKATPGEETIVLSSYILGDGQGDWAHLEKEAKELSKKFPQRRITLIAIAAEKHNGKLKPKKRDNVYHHLGYSGNGIHCSPSIMHSPFEDHEKLIQTIKDAAVWLAGPVAINGIFDSLQDQSTAKGFAINEYGFENGNHKNKEFLNKIRLGLGNEEIGIYTSKIEQDCQWDKVENEVLKNLLFGTETVQSSHVKSYLSEYALYMCYVSDDDNAMRFIHRALFFSHHHANGKKIDIIYPGKTNLEGLKETLKYIRFPIASLKVNDEDITENKEKGFHIRIINPGKLSKKDFKRVMFLSGPLVACTGNFSLGQALSFGKIPYYEKLDQTLQTKKNLGDLAWRTCGADSPLVYLFEPEQRLMWVPPEEREILKSNRLLEDALKLSQVIKEQYSLNGRLRGMVNTHLCCTKFPQFAAAVSEIKTQYIAKKINLSTVNDQIISKLLEIGLLDHQIDVLPQGINQKEGSAIKILESNDL